MGLPLDSIPGLNTTLEVQIGGDWFDLGSVADISASGGEAPEADLVTYGGVAKATGHARVPSFSAPIPVYNPIHQTFVSAEGKQPGCGLVGG